MTQDELSQEVTTAVKSLEDYAKQLTATLEVLKRTRSSDATITAMKECKALLDELPDANVKATIRTVQKALKARVLELVKELTV